MAITFAINGTTITYIVDADWSEPTPQNQALGGKTSHDRYIGHTWRSPEIMTITDFQNLSDLEGQRVTIQTTNFYDRNSQKTYYGVHLLEVRGNHESLTFRGVECRFLIRV